MNNIALDAMGGDGNSDELVLGAVQAVDDYELEVTLLGDQGVLEKALDKALPKVFKKDVGSRIHIVHTTEVVGMDEAPFEAIRKKKNSSIVTAFNLVKEGRTDAVVSAGNSGATLAAAVKILRRLKNISRPGIAGVYPTLKGVVVMMDVGANVDCRAQHLFQFGVMASAFSKVVFGINSPKVGLLSIGEERGKGNSLVKSTHELLQNSSLNYIGNVEGRSTFQGDVDIIVCDGFVGNVCLKLTEGLAEVLVAMLKEEISKNYKAKMGYLLARDAFARFRKRLDYAEYGGAPMLGFNGTGIVCHGRSNSLAIKNAIKQANLLVKDRVNDHILAMLDSSTDLSKPQAVCNQDSVLGQVI
jgi:phosphate acyltransferase